MYENRSASCVLSLIFGPVLSVTFNANFYSNAQLQPVQWYVRRKWLENYTLLYFNKKTTSKHICAVAIKLKLYLVLNGYGPYKHIAVCLEDKPGRVLSKAVLG